MSGGYLMCEQLTPSLPGLPPLSLLLKYSIFCILRLQSPADFQVPPTPSCSVQGAKFSETHWNIKPRKDAVVDSCGLAVLTRNLNWLSQRNRNRAWCKSTLIITKHKSRWRWSCNSTLSIVGVNFPLYNSVRNTEERPYIAWSSLQTECICSGIMRGRGIILFEWYFTSRGQNQILSNQIQASVIRGNELDMNQISASVSGQSRQTYFLALQVVRHYKCNNCAFKWLNYAC